jgi:hypothetical protein
MTILEANRAIRVIVQSLTNKTKPADKPAKKVCNSATLKKVSLVRPKRKPAKGVVEVTIKCPGLRK